jgi:lysophospholipid acyltransferase (LPLAT)-like uncharacterized protein
MKIRRKGLVKAVGFAVGWLVRLWVGTVRYHYRPLGPNLDPTRPEFRGRYLYAFWHENILIPAYHYGRRDIWVLISQHADGRLIAEACRHLGFRTVEGSSTRGGVQSVRRMVRLGKVGHLAVTPDGPRGPRRRVQPGLTYLASRTGLPIVPIGIAFSGAWRMWSWDRFALPHPYSASWCVTTEPIHVPADADKVVLEEYRQRVEQELERASRSAEAWAAGGTEARFGSPYPRPLDSVLGGEGSKSIFPLAS